MTGNHQCYLGMRVDKIDNNVTSNQETYITSTLERFNLQELKPNENPEVDLKLEKQKMMKI